MTDFKRARRKRPVRDRFSCADNPEMNLSVRISARTEEEAAEIFFERIVKNSADVKSEAVIGDVYVRNKRGLIWRVTVDSVIVRDTSYVKMELL